MNFENLTFEEKEALANAKLSDLRKKLNADSWSDNMEILMKKWGEKAAGLRFMHSHSGSKWKSFSDQLAISGIVVTGIASTISLKATLSNLSSTNIFGITPLSYCLLASCTALMCIHTL